MTSTDLLTYHTGREVQRTAERDSTQELRKRSSTQFYTQRGLSVHADLYQHMLNTQLAFLNLNQNLWLDMRENESEK